MTDLTLFIRKDGQKQIGIGILLLMVACVFTLLLFLSHFSIQILIVTITAVFTGISILISGLRDLQVSKNTRLTMSQHDTGRSAITYPNRMFLEQKMNQINLLDMKDNYYCSIQDHETNRNSTVRKVITFIVDLINGAFSIRVLMPAKYKIIDANDKVAFYVQKKAGFHWRGYVFNAESKCVAYLDSTSKEKNLILSYIDNKGICWKAFRDMKEFITITDLEGREQAVMKPGAIPLESAERFGQVNGCLLDWTESGKLPYSLLTFVFVLSIRSGRI